MPIHVVFSRICEVYATGVVRKQGVNDIVTDEEESIGAVILPCFPSG